MQALELSRRLRPDIDVGIRLKRARCQHRVLNAAPQHPGGEKLGPRSDVGEPIPADCARDGHTGREPQPTNRPAGTAETLGQPARGVGVDLRCLNRSTDGDVPSRIGLAGGTRQLTHQYALRFAMVGQQDKQLLNRHQFAARDTAMIENELYRLMTRGCQRDVPS